MYTCEDCKHYRKHYVRVNDRFFMAIADGHCVYPRLKCRKRITPACKNFVLHPKQAASQP